MKMKRVAIVALILGFVTAVTGLIMPLIYWSSYTANHGAIGIIGGAGAPTYGFALAALFDGLPMELIIVGVGLMIVSGLYLILSKIIKKNR